MGTVGGFGTMYYGWEHLADGRAVVTKWIVVCFMPVVPLGRLRLVQLSDPDSEARVPGGLKILAVFAGGKVRDEYRILERLTIDWRSVAKTYLKAYVLLPLLLALPVAAVFGLALLLKQLGVSGEMNLVVSGLGLCACMGFALAVGATAVHRARGGRKQAMGARREPGPKEQL